MLKNKFIFGSKSFSKLAVSFITLILCQIYPEIVHAQDSDNFLLVRDTPAAFQSITLRPDVVAFGDITNNGFDDIVFAENGRNPQFLLYNPDSNAFFRPVYENFLQANGNLRNLPSGIVSNYGPIAIIDITNDGQNEVVFFSSRFGTNAFASTWVDTIMTVTPPTAGLNNVSFRGSTGVQFGDINQDGKLDMHMTSEAAQNIRNWLVYNIFNLEGEPHNNTSDDDAVRISAASRSNYLFDFDNDGWLDLYVNNGGGQQDELYRGTQNGFKEQAGHPLTEISSSWASAIGDFNNNGLLDIYRTNPGSNRNSFFVNQGNLEFSRNTSDISALDRLDSRGATWADIENNGWLDLAVAENAASVSLYRNLKDGSFQKMADEPIMNFVGNWRHVIFFDLNQNGKLDALTLGKHSGSPVTVYRNVSDNNNNWIGVRLSQTNAFQDQAFGATLELTATIGGQQITQKGVYNPFQGRFSQHPTPVHFGLENATSATLRITWPSGLQTTHNLGASDINTYLFFEEPIAGKLNQSSEDITLIASLRDVARDTIYFNNIGMADVAISAIENSNPHITVESFTQNVAVRDQGYVAILYSPTEFEDLQVRSDTVFVSSNAIDGHFPLVFTTDGRTNPAEFSKFHDEENPLLSRSSAAQKSIWADFTGNGLKDVIILIENANNRLYFQTERSEFVFQENSIISNEGRFSTAGIAGDYNRDGLVDVFMTNPDGENYFYKNQGSGNFTRKYVHGISGRFRTSTGASFYDFNKNGFLDLFITNSSGQTNEILLFENDSTYVSVSAGDITSRNNYAVSHLIRDLDGDGWPEIVVTNRNTLTGISFIEFYRGNPDVTFTRIQVPGITDAPYQSAGVASFDFDSNGLPDLLFLNDIGSIPMRMYRNEGELNFSRHNEAFLSSFRSSPSDLVFLDYNLNGFTDVFITDIQFNNPNVLLESIDGPNFIQINAGELVTEADRASFGAALLDFNDNGRPDLFITNYFNNNELFLNTSVENNWLRVNPISTRGNHSSLLPGTKVSLRATIGGQERTLSRWVGGQSLFSPVIGPVFFGLGDAESAHVIVTFPDGSIEEQTVTELNRSITIDLATSTETIEDNIPTEFALHGNYPNPFNPVTNLRFDLPEATTIRLTIYNSIGQRVAILADGNRPAGIHEIIFDASQLPSGLYLAVLQTEGQQFVQKMMLIK